MAANVAMPYLNSRSFNYAWQIRFYFPWWWISITRAIFLPQKCANACFRTYKIMDVFKEKFRVSMADYLYQPIIVGYVLTCRSYSLFVQYTISLSSLCKLFWRHWTYKMPVRYILSSVCVRLSIFSQLSIIHYVGCVFSVYLFPLWWLREYIYVVSLSSSNRKYELLPIV